MDNQEHEVRLNIISHAGQVALEFLRENPQSDEKKASADHNKIFKVVYEGMTETVTK